MNEGEREGMVDESYGSLSDAHLIIYSMLSDFYRMAHLELNRLPEDGLRYIEDVLINGSKENNFNEMVCGITKAIEWIMRLHEDYINKLKNSGQIYLIKWGSIYKIGRAKNASERFNQIKSNYKKTEPVMPYEMILVHTIKAKNMYLLEKILHKKYESKRKNGEWFELSPNDVSEIMGIYGI